MNSEASQPLTSPKSPRAVLNDGDQLKNTIIAAIGNFSTAYNLVVINVVHVIVENQYCNGDNCKTEVDLASTACLVGAIAGQLCFGYVGDCLGRPVAMQLTMALSILGALVSAFAVPISDNKASIFTFLAITRFVLGVGVGGVYPLSATIAQESSSSKDRGFKASLVFSMQGVANLGVPLMAMACIAIFGAPAEYRKDSSDLGWSWRVLLGMGAVPGICLLPFKVKGTEPQAAATTEPTSPDIEALNMTPPAPANMTLMEALSKREYWGKLLGTAGGWFLFDITFYGNGLFQSTVLREVFGVTASHANKHGKFPPTPVSGTLSEDVFAQMAVVGAIGLPGYYVAVYLMDRWGRKKIQLQGFFFMAVAFATLGFFVKQLESVPVLMLIIYGLTFFFSNFGPNSTTFILPAETFPPHMRTTMNGFSAAMGKVGATIGSAAFKPLENGTSLGFTMVTCAVVSLVGLVITWLFVEDRMGMTMEGDADDEEVDEKGEHRYEQASE